MNLERHHSVSKTPLLSRRFPARTPALDRLPVNPALRDVVRDANRAHPGRKCQTGPRTLMEIGKQVDWKL